MDMEFFRERMRRAAWHVNDVAEEIETAHAEGRELLLDGMQPLDEAIMRLRDAARVALLADDQGDD
jgi:hypothetical protein